MTQEQYTNLLQKAFASEYAFYLKAQNFHWNVEGYLFPQYHEFFGHIYEEVGGSIDTFAEQLRAARVYAPAAFTVLEELSDVRGQTGTIDGMQMTQELLLDSDMLAEMFKTAFLAAEEMGDYGLSNFFADRQDAHRKHSWMLRSTLK